MFKDPKGISGTILFHGALLLVIAIFGFSTPLPLPAEQGILINFGTDETGTGELEPQFYELPDEQTAQPEETSVVPAEEGQLSQDFEEAPSIKEKNPEKTVVKQDVTPKETIKENNKTDVKLLLRNPGN
jgi:colicin import membrane protein